MGDLNGTATEVQYTFITRLDNKEADRSLVEIIRYEMIAKLADKRGEGRGGWHDPSVISEDELMAMLRENLDKGDMVDVVNLAAMVHVRRELFGAGKTEEESII